MSEVLKTEALILGALRWRESSKIVHLYTRELGAVSVIAKGALRPKSPFRGALEALNLTEVVLNYKGQRSLQNLNQAELTSPFFNIREDLAKTAVAYGMLEVLQKLMREHEAVPDFFDYLTALLGKLDQSPFGAEPFLWHFLLTISEVLGFGWQLGFFPDSGEIPGLFPVHLDERRGCIAPGAGHQHSLRLDKTAWETLTDWAQRPPQELDTAGDPRGLPLQITQVLLRYLSHHTETPLVLNSLKWYVQ